MKDRFVLPFSNKGTKKIANINYLDLFYYLNTILLFLIVIYVSILMFSNVKGGLFQLVYSNDETQEETTGAEETYPGPTELELILTELNVEFSSRTNDDVCFEQTFRSDGLSGDSLTPDRKANFNLASDIDLGSPAISTQIENEAIRNALLSGNNSNGDKLSPIELPGEICVDSAKMVNVGEIKFNKIRKTSAPSNFVCDERILESEDPSQIDERSEQLENCLFDGVMVYALLESGTSRDILVQKEEITGNFNNDTNEEGSGEESVSVAGETSVIDSVTNYFANLLSLAPNETAVTSGTPDPLNVLGTVNFVSEDEFGANALNNIDFLSTLEVEVDSLGFQQNISSITGELSPSSLGNKEFGNLGNTQVYGDTTTLDEATGIGAIFGERVNGSISEEVIKDEPEGGNIFAQLANRLSQNLFGVKNGNDTSDIFSTDKAKLSPHNPVRAIGDTNKFSVEYDFCEATDGLNVPNTPDINNDLEKIYEKLQVESISNNTEIPPYRKGDEKYQCLSKFMKYSDVDSLIGSSLEQCAINLLEGSSNCIEFDVKEDELTFDFAEKSIPAGLTTYSLNNTYNLYTPNDDTGPFINPISIYGCSKLTVVYELKENSQIVKKFTSATNNFTAGNPTQPVSEYCVVGSLFGNLSWVFLNFANNYSNTEELEQPNRQFPKEALTCDKRNETAEFGAEPVWTDIGGSLPNSLESGHFGPHNDIIYISRDQNSGYFNQAGVLEEVEEGSENTQESPNEKVLTSEDVTLNVGPSRYRLDFLSETGIDLPIYGDNIRILFGNSDEPQYAYFTAIERPENDQDEIKYPMYLCKIDPATIIPKTAQEKKSTNSCIRLSDNQQEAGYGSFIEVENGQSIVFTSLEKDIKESKTLIRRCILPTNITEEGIPAINKNGTAVFNSNEEFLSIDKPTCFLNPLSTVTSSISNPLKSESYYGLKNMVKQGSDITFLLNDEFYVNSENISPESAIDLRLLQIRQTEIDLSGFSDISVSDNLCKTFSARGYCNYIATNGFVSTYLGKSDIGSLVATMAGSGVGLIWNGSGNASQGTDTSVSLPNIFGYKQFTEGYSLSRENFYDEISYVSSIGENHHIFMSKSGYYLNVYPSSQGILLGPQTDYACTNCLLTKQYAYNPMSFDSDCTDYYGKGVCGYPKLEKLGLPKVFYARNIMLETIDNSTTPYSRPVIDACYTLSGLSKAVLCSEYGYSLTGVYSRVEVQTEAEEVGKNQELNGYRVLPLYKRIDIPENNQETPTSQTDDEENTDSPVNENIQVEDSGLSTLEEGVEYSNTYAIASQYQEDKLDNLSIAILNSNSGSSTVTTGNEIRVIDDGTPDGIVREIYDYTNPSRAECYRKMEEIVSRDVFFDITGAEQINLNPSNITGGSSSSSGSNAGFSGQNSGEYCESTWCFEGDPDLAFNPDFENDSENNELVSVLTDYVVSKSTYSSNDARILVEAICKKSDTKGIPCELLVGIWGAESGFARHGTAFGCFLDGYMVDFYTQLDCAVDFSLGSETGGINYKNWQANRTNTVLSGNGSVFTHPKGNLDKPPEQRVGKCTPGTGFAYISNRYTPNDKRIDIENQCNRGVVERTDHGKYCTGDTHSILGGGRIFETNYPFPIGDIIEGPLGQKRNWRAAFQAIQDYYEQNGKTPRLKISEQCYPGRGVSSSNSVAVNSSNSQSKEDLINLLSSQGMDESAQGSASFNIKGMGDPYYSNAVMVLDELGLRFKDGNSSNQIVHIIKPGEKFSYNEAIGYPSDATISQKQLKLTAEGYFTTTSGVGGTILGQGWCEVATTISRATRNVNGIKGDPLSRDELASVTGVSKDKFYGAGSLDLNGAIGPKLSSGEKLSDISYVTSLQHSSIDQKPGETPNETLRDYYNGLAIGDESMLNSGEEFVLIMLVPTLRNNYLADGDLDIFNNDKKGRNIYLAMTVEDGILHVVAGFGKGGGKKESYINNINSTRNALQIKNKILNNLNASNSAILLVGALSMGNNKLKRKKIKYLTTYFFSTEFLRKKIFF